MKKKQKKQTLDEFIKECEKQDKEDAHMEELRKKMENVDNDPGGALDAAIEVMDKLDGWNRR